MNVGRPLTVYLGFFSHVHFLGEREGRLFDISHADVNRKRLTSDWWFVTSCTLSPRRAVLEAGFSSVPTLCDPWTAACQASLSITNSQSLLELMSIESVMPSNRLILCSPFSPAFSLSQHQGLLYRVGFLHQVVKVLKLQHQSFQWIVRVNFL